MTCHVYVSNAGSRWFSHFLQDEATGRLSPQADIALDGEPGAVAASADGTRMFVSLRSLQCFASYAVDRASGALTPLSRVPLRDGAPYVTTDRTDRFLLAAYYGSGHVSVHRIDARGALGEEPVQWITTRPHAHSIQTDPSNRFAFVPHTLPANTIYQFRFDAETGILTPNEPPRVDMATPEGPRHFVFHPGGMWVYSVNEDGSTVSAFHFDPVRGVLMPFQLISTLPPEGCQGNTTAEIEVSPDGRFLYASNRGHDSLSVFRVEEDGTLQAQGHVPTEPTPRFFALDPTGRYVYALGQGSSRMAAYRRDVLTGDLDPLGVYDVGENPLWITFIPRQKR